MFIDSHAHLYDLTDSEILDVTASAASAGVKLIVNTAVNYLTSAKVVRQSSLHDSLLSAVGISPFDVESFSDGDLDNIESLLVSDKKVIAVGETGIDSTNPRYPSLNKQWYVFEKMLELANKYSVPIIVHSRGSEKEVYSYCKGKGYEKVVFHCYTGDADLAGKIANEGYYISLSGIVTFKNGNMDDVVRNIPLDRLILETDSPYLAPTPLRGTKNIPSNVVLIYRKVAKLWSCELSTLESNIGKNFKELFYPDNIQTETLYI